MSRWRSEGASAALVWARWAVLRSALSWAAARGVVRSNPLEVMRGPSRPLPRKHLLPAEVAALLATASRQVAQAAADLRAKPRDGRLLEALFVAEQTHLLVRLAADTGARRGELAVLRLSGLDGRVLSIERNLSLEVLGPTKTSRNRRLTLGATTAMMIVEHFGTWQARVGPAAVVGDWVFAPDYRRRTNARAELLSHRFDRLRRAAGVPDAALHRLCHSVGTHLVSEGKLLKAQGRLGHRDPVTTLRHYAHATPLDDQDVADNLDESSIAPPGQRRFASPHEHNRASTPSSPSPSPVGGGAGGSKALAGVGPCGHPDPGRVPRAFRDGSVRWVRVRWWVGTVAAWAWEGRSRGWRRRYVVRRACGRGRG